MKNWIIRIIIKILFKKNKNIWGLGMGQSQFPFIYIFYQKVKLI